MRKTYLSSAPGLTLGLLLVASILPSGCVYVAERAKHPEIMVESSVNPQPPLVGAVLITISFTQNGKGLDDGLITVEARPLAGGKSVFCQAKELEAGRYDAEFVFTEPGDFAITVRANFADERAVLRNLPDLHVQPR